RATNPLGAWSIWISSIFELWAQLQERGQLQSTRAAEMSRATRTTPTGPDSYGPRGVPPSACGLRIGSDSRPTWPTTARAGRRKQVDARLHGYANRMSRINEATAMTMPAIS